LRAWNSKVIPETGLEILIYLTSQKRMRVEDPKKTREEIESKTSAYELVKRAKDTGMPKQELDLIKIRLGIASTDTDDESKILKELALKKLLDKQ
jgi:hypothetical protein